MNKSIENLLRKDLYDKLGITVLNEYPTSTPVFPVVTLEEKVNEDDLDTRTSSGTKHVNSALEINIYTKGARKKADALDLAYDINQLLGGEYKLPKVMGNPIDNFIDREVYRYVIRYSFKIGTNNKIYRG